MGITKKGIGMMLTQTYSHLDRFKIGVGSSAFSFDDLDLETPVEVNPEEYYGNILDGYPDVDTDNLTVETRFFLSNIEGNDNTISEIGLIDKDGNLFSRNLITPISKNDSVEISFEITDEWEAP